MPQILSDKLEPNTSSIITKLKSVEKFEQKGWDIHFNFSPVIFCKDWLIYYKELFQTIKNFGLDRKCEVIFLTHNANLHQTNLENKFEFEDLLWTPHIQEEKISEYGGLNLRYSNKHILIKQFKELYSNYFDLNNIRYIF